MLIAYMRVLTQLLPKLLPQLVRVGEVDWGGGGGLAWQVRGLRGWSFFPVKPKSPKSVKKFVLFPSGIFFHHFC